MFRDFTGSIGALPRVYSELEVLDFDMRANVM